MVDEREDPIEAIKRRNEERARRLRERIARGEFGDFATPLEAVDESLPTGLDALETPDLDFDLSSFPPPPETEAITLEASPPPSAPPEITITAQPSAPPSSEPVSWPPAEPPAPPPLEPEPALTAAPASPPDSLSGLELSDLDFDTVSDFLAPEPWDGAAPPPLPEEPAAAVTEPAPPPGIEIEVEPEAVGAITEPIVPAVGVNLPGRPREEAIPAPVNLDAEPALREEEAEAIKSTIERDLREVPPAAPPISIAEPVVVPTAPAPVAAPVAVPREGEAGVFIGIEVDGNRVRIERRNITLASAVELFRAIIDRYENR